MAKNVDKYQIMTYYNLPENYHYFENTDVTKFDSLTGDEIDANFFVLEGRDIQSIDVVRDEETGESRIVTTFINGEVIESENPFDEYIESLSFDYDQEDGVLTICVNDCDEEPLRVEGFLTVKDIRNILKDYYTYTDGTISGDGTSDNPLSIARSHRTGCVKPVNGIVEKLPTSGMTIGDRYIAYNAVDNSGRYYNFDGLLEVISALEEEGNGWKVANKHDWDDMLNHFETGIFKDHNGMAPSKWLGKKANTVLKNSIDFELDYCGYVFNGDEKSVSFRDERAQFWTASNAAGRDLCSKDTEAWVKQFMVTRGQVYQTIVDNAIYSSIRLVKDIDDEIESSAEILGEIYPVSVMIGDKGKSKMWTTVNLNYQTETARNSFKDNSEIVNKPFIYEWDGDKWIIIKIEDYTSFMLKADNRFYYVHDNEIFLVNCDKAPTQKLTDATNYVYDDYEYKGEFVISENSVEYNISLANIGEGGKNIMNDFARFLGALYRTNKVEPIQFKYKYYDWDDEGTLKGSNYKLIGEPIRQDISLVTAIVLAYNEDPTQVFKVKFDHTIVNVTINVFV